MIKLFEHPLSPYAQKVKLALIEKGIPFETAMPDLMSGGDAAFRAANPRLEVPALVDGDVTRLRFDDHPRIPRGQVADSRRCCRPRRSSALAPARSRRSATRNTRRSTGASSRSASSDAPRAASPTTMIARAGKQIAGLNAHLDRALGGAEYFNGATFGWADLSVIPHVNAARGRERLPAARRIRRSRAGSIACASGRACSACVAEAHRHHERLRDAAAAHRSPGCSCASTAIIGSNGCCARAAPTSCSRA